MIKSEIFYIQKVGKRKIQLLHLYLKQTDKQKFIFRLTKITENLRKKVKTKINNKISIKNHLKIKSPFYHSQKLFKNTQKKYELLLYNNNYYRSLSKKLIF